MNNTKNDFAKPFFSIVLPIYNVEKYLDRCNNSILKQNFENYEIILVDDGSKDNCPEMCDDWAKKDKRIKVIHKENAGLGYARNTGLSVATGKYIFFFDSDDYILPGTFESVWNTINKDMSQAVFFGMQRIDSNGNTICRLDPTPQKTFYDDTDEIKNSLLADFIARNPYTGEKSNLRISACSCCLNIDFLRNNQLEFVSEREYISEDTYFFIELFNKLQTASIIKDIFYCYCQNDSSLTTSYKENRFELLKDFYKKLHSKVVSLNYADQVQLRLKASFISNVMGCLKMEAANLKKSGIKKSYQKVKQISNDTYLIDNITDYPLSKCKKTWTIFAFLIRKKMHICLFTILLLQYYTKKV